LRPRAFLLCFLILAAVARAQYMETTINLGVSPLAILWHATSNKVYTGNAPNTVSVIGGSSNQIDATIPVPLVPLGLCSSPSLNKVYVACTNDTVVVIDGLGDSILARVEVPGGPWHLAYSAKSEKLYVSCELHGRIVVIDGNSDTIIREVELTRYGKTTMLWNRGSNRLFCTSESDTVWVLDCETDEVVVRTQVEGSDGTWCYNPANEMSYLEGRRGIYVFSSMGDSIVEYVPGCSVPVCFAPFPNKLYTSYYPGQIRVLDCRTHTVTETLATYLGPFVCDTVKGKVYVGYAHKTDSLGVIDARADTLLEQIPCVGTRYAACWNQTDSRVYFINPDVGLIYVIRDTSAGVVETPDAGHRAIDVGPTIVRGVLFLPPSSFTLHYSLFTISGQKGLNLSSGPNDVSNLAPGVYFVRSEPLAVSREPSAVTVRKVVVAR